MRVPADYRSVVKNIKKNGYLRVIQAILEQSYPYKVFKEYNLERKYGESAPKYNDVIAVDPNDINYTLEDCPYRVPNFGILQGDWDNYKHPIDDNPMTIGLREHFEEEMPWEDTQYYRYAMSEIEKGRIFSPLPSNYPNNEDGLLQYLHYLDGLFLDVQTNGFASQENLNLRELPATHIDRFGNFILTHGHHRTVMAKIMDLDSIPVRVAVRHKDWQEKRYQAWVKMKKCDHNDLKNLPDF